MTDFNILLSSVSTVRCPVESPKDCLNTSLKTYKITPKSPGKLADKDTKVLHRNKNGLIMLTKLKSKLFRLKTQLFEIRWYPSDKGCVRPGRHKVKPQHMPPLMVRKAEWRR